VVLQGLSAGTHKKRSRTLRALLLFAAFFLSFVGWMAALDPSHRISQYGHTAWRIQDGYFAGDAWSITQTTDGYIWVGTAAGVLRFDGVQFVPWTSLSGEKLPSNVIHPLLGARDGSLWIGTMSGLVHWVNQRSITYLSGEIINAVRQDEKGQIWVTGVGQGGTTSPLCRIIDSDIHCFGADEGVPTASGDSMVEDTSGNFWLGGDTTLLRWRPGSSKVYRPAALQSNQGIGGVQALAAAADGSLWVGMGVPTHGGGLQHMIAGALKPCIVPKLNSETLDVQSLLIDRQGTLWVGTDAQGFYRIHGSDVDHFGSADGLSSDNVLGFFEDREGNLWVETSKGIDMLRDLRVSSISKREGLYVDAVKSVLAAQDGTVWIGSDRLQALGPDGVISEPKKGLPGNQVTSLFEDHAGRLWVGSDNALWVYENRKFNPIKRPDGKAFGLVMGLTEDSEHNVWVESRGPPTTLIRVQDLKVQEEFPAPPMPVARKLALDPQIGIWLGLMNGNLARFRSGKTEIFTFANHPNTRVKALFAAPDGSILGGTEFGVVGWKNGRQQILTVRNGLPCNDTNGLISDDQGNLWLYTGCGLVEIPKDEVQRWWAEPEGKLKVRVFDVLDGVQSGVGHFNTSAKTPDGRLWFANGSVLQTVDPAHMAGNTVPPPVHINSIVADRKSYSPQEALTLPALTRDLEINYTAPSFTAPRKVLFRYTLEGRDAGWVEPGTRRQAFYNDLRPGHYRFRVIACNNDGLWNETGASLNLSIAPAYYQTPWFRAACVAALLLILWGIYQLRLRQIHRQFSIALEARVDERTRIARELHDTLLQSFNALLLRFQTVSNLLPSRPDEAKARIDSVIEEGSNAITEGRDAVHELRSAGLMTTDLAQSIRNFAKELLVNPSSENFPEFLVQVEGTPMDLNPVVRDEVYRIAAEALRNAIRHAGAKRIEVEIRYDHEDLNLRIRDDGKGINASVLDKEHAPGHWGLRGMRERAKLIGASFEIWSKSGSGTEIELKIPAASAYTKPLASRR
jgi:signal transduction histidine kinase/ligand-binding sensor domain-containing protein